MKKIVIGGLFAFCLGLSFALPSIDSFNRLLEPSIGLKELSDAILVDGGKNLPQDRFFLITGRLGVLMDRSPEEGPFLGETELVGGEWEGLDTVRSFRVYLSFQGNRFSAMADDEDPNYVKPGTLVVIIGSLMGTSQEYGTKKPVGLIKVERLIKIE